MEGLPKLAGLTLGVDHQPVRFLLGIEQRFLLAALGVTFGVLERAKRLLFGPSDGLGGDPLAIRHPHREDECGRDERDDQVQQQTVCRQHA